MKAVSYSEHGGVEVLQTVDLPDPEPGPIDVVVAVEACALNRLDLVQRNGYYTLPGYTLPHIAGMDVAGDGRGGRRRRHQRRRRRPGRRRSVTGRGGRRLEARRAWVISTASWA